MGFVFADVGARKKDYPDMLDPMMAAKVNARLLTLDEYYELARRIICRFAPRNARTAMLASEDAIEFVAHHIMVGDWGYDPGRSNIKTCRGYCGKRAIQDYLGMLADEVTFRSLNDDSFHDSIPDAKTPSPGQEMEAEENQHATRDYIRRLMGCLSPVQRSCITMRFFQNMSMQAIGNQLNMTREGVRHSIANAMKKMKEAGKNE